MNNTESIYIKKLMAHEIKPVPNQDFISDTLERLNQEPTVSNEPSRISLFAIPVMIYAVFYLLYTLLTFMAQFNIMRLNTIELLHSTLSQWLMGPLTSALVFSFILLHIVESLLEKRQLTHE